MEQPGDDLIVKFNQGDTEAFTVLYTRYYYTLYNFVKRFIPDREDAEDLTAEVFVKLWKLRFTGSSVSCNILLALSIRLCEIKACTDEL